MDKLNRPVPVFIAAMVFGYIAMQLGYVEGWIIFLLSFILAKQFERKE